MLRVANIIQYVQKTLTNLTIVMDIFPPGFAYTSSLISVIFPSKNHPPKSIHGCSTSLQAGSDCRADMYTITPVYARIAARELSRRGLSVPLLLRNTTLTIERLDIGDNISSQDFVTLLKNGLALSGDPTLDLMIGQSASIVALGPMGAVLA